MRYAHIPSNTSQRDLVRMSLLVGPSPRVVRDTRHPFDPKGR